MIDGRSQVSSHLRKQGCQKGEAKLGTAILFKSRLSATQEAGGPNSSVPDGLGS